MYKLSQDDLLGFTHKRPFFHNACLLEITYHYFFDDFSDNKNNSFIYKFYVTDLIKDKLDDISDGFWFFDNYTGDFYFTEESDITKLKLTFF